MSGRNGDTDMLSNSAAKDKVIVAKMDHGRKADFPISKLVIGFKNLDSDDRLKCMLEHINLMFLQVIVEIS